MPQLSSATVGFWAREKNVARGGPKEEVTLTYLIGEGEYAEILARFDSPHQT